MANRPPPPAAAEAPASLLQTLPQAPAPAPRALAMLPQGADEEAAAKPIIVRGTGPRVPAAAGAATPSEEAGDITLNFAGADIRDVIDSVLGKTLHLNYVVDAGVAGPVTFNVSRKLSRAEVLPVLEAVLESRGFVMVRSDGIVRIMARANDGKAHAAVPLAAAGAIGARTEVFPLRFIAPADVMNVLAKTLPAGTVMVPDARRGLLLVQGTSDELSLAGDTVRIFDVDQLRGTSVAVLPLQKAEAATVVLELQSIFDATRKEEAANVIRFLPVDRLNAVMVIAREPRSLDEARAWVARLDRTRNMNEQRIYVYYLQYGKAGQVAQTLQGALSGMDVEVKAPETANAQGLGAAPTVGGLAVPPSAPGFPTPPPLIAALAPPAPPPAPASTAAPARPSIKIEADDAHNALLISATPRDYALIRQVLEGIDTPPLQVLIEVTVAEIVLNDNLRYGVEYFLNSRGNSGGNLSTLLTTGTTAAIAPTVPGFSLAFTGANLQPRVILDALSALTQTKVISTPRLMVLDDQTARLQVGDVVPIITQSAASTVSTSPLVLSNVEYKETGVVLEVTPRVNASGNVTLEVKQSVSSVVPTTTSTINSPTFSQRRLTSTISVKSGNSILLGGLIQNEDDRSRSGIPFLSDIPVLGALFGSRNNTARRTELIMFMTPYVLASDRDATDITQRIAREFKAALDSSTLVPPRPVPR
jgi:general secretion pathway protein D